MKDGTVVTRNGNYFKVKKGSDGHYFTALLLGNATVTAWHRTSKKKILENYTVVENYDGDKEQFKWIDEI